MNDDKPVAFPLEHLHPGLHERRPDIAAAEAEVFLRDGHKSIGFDLSQPRIRQELLGRTPFVDFAIRPRPAAIEEMLRRLPKSWQENPETYPLAEEINQTTERHFGLPAQFYVSVDEEHTFWVRLRP